ncbi:MAG: hypothetical protein GJ680_14700 [Alteromonadaceae bacterium]|nr:hypothetical protein [Alteromonadaceae bacterium]
MFIVITEKEVVLSKRDYQSFAEIRNDFYNLVSWQGPLSAEDLITFLETEYGDLAPSGTELVEGLIHSEHFEIVVKTLN